MPDEPKPYLPLYRLCAWVEAPTASRCQSKVGVAGDRTSCYRAWQAHRQRPSVISRLQCVNLRRKKFPKHMTRAYGSDRITVQEFSLGRSKALATPGEGRADGRARLASATHLATARWV